MRRPALALLLGCLLLVAGVSALDGYDYYQTIEYAACDQETYQQDIVIHRSAGTAYNETAGGLETWHIYVGDHCQADYDDVRFTNSTGAELDYYLWPDHNSTSARFAVRLEGADAAGEVTVHYGNPSATATSDGDATFHLFDQFDGTAIDTGKWDVIQSTGLSVSGGELRASQGADYRSEIFSRSTVPSNILIQFRIQSRTYYTSIGFGNADLSGTGSSIGLTYYTDYESAIYSGPPSSNRWIPPRSRGASSTDGDVIPSPPTGYYTEEFVIPEGGKLKERRNGGEWTVSTRYSGVSGPKNIQFYHTGTYAAAALDYILVRAYSAAPPTLLTFNGEQETAAPPVTTFTASPTAGLAPLTVQFTDLSTGGPTSWAWTFGDSGTSTAQSPQHTYTTAGTYSVNLTATNEYGSDYELKTDYITVYSPITAQFTANITGGTAPLTVQFIDLSTGSPTSWLWSFGDGNTSTAQNPQHTYTTAGTHTVTLTASHPYDSDTETKTAYITVAVLQPFPGLTLIPRDLTGNGLYTDINGNNRLDYNDLTIFFLNLAWARDNEPTECFDFNQNGRLDYADVIALFQVIKNA